MVVKRVREYKWHCPSCLTQGISSVLWKEGVPIGANLTCPECFWTMDRYVRRVLDDTCREIPPEHVETLTQRFWCCEACKAYNQFPKVLPKDFTADDLYCTNCETFQSDIPGHPNIVPSQSIPQVEGDVSRSRWDLAPEEIGEHVDLTSAKEEFNKEFPTPPTPPVFKIPNIPKLNKAILGGALALTVLGISAYAIVPIPLEAQVTSLRAEVSAVVQQYDLVEEEGWVRNAPTTSKDYRLLRSAPRVSGTILVPDNLSFPPDGVERYMESVLEVVGHREETVMKDVSSRVPDGTKEVCRNTMQGAVAVEDCEDVKQYRSITTPTPTQVQVPIKDWVDKPRTRNHFRKEDVIEMWAEWEVGKWQTIARPQVISQTSEIPELDTSKWVESTTLRIGPLESRCSIKVDQYVQTSIPLNCTTFSQLREGATIKGRRSRMLGVIGDLAVE